LSRQGPQTSSVLRPGVNVVSNPDLSAGFADVDAATKAAIIVSDAGTNDVYVYSTAGKLTATITGFNEPQGLGGDALGDLYVANTGNSDVLVYPNTYKKIKATLTDPGQSPVGVDVTPTGVVGVTNIITTAGGPGSVSFYAKGKTTPCVTVANANWGRVYFGAFDDAGNFYIDGETPSGAVIVGVVKGECKAKAITTLTTANTITFPGGVHVSPTDKIAIDDQSGAAIYTYNPPVKNALGTPVSTTPITGASDPVTFAFTKTAADVWTADAGLAESLEYKYPAGGSPVKTITGFTQPIGVVVTPLEAP